MADFFVKAVENLEEHVALRKLTSLVFRGSVDEERIRATMDYACQRPQFQLDQHRIGLLDGEIVAHAAAWPYRMQYGETTLRFGGIGGVCTLEAQRHQGYASAVMRDAIAYMTARGDHFSLLITGTVNFYTQLGYHTLWSDGRLKIQAAAAAALDSTLSPRPATLADVPQMAALYDQHVAGRVSMPRSPATWHWRMMGDPDQYRQVVEDSSGRLVGYIVGIFDNYMFELAADSDKALGALLAETGRTLLAHGPDTLSILVTPDEALLHRVRRMVACEMVTRYVPGADWMARIIDAEGLRQAVLPEMLRQAVSDERGLIFALQPEAVYLGLRGQDSTNVQLDQGTFLQILFGLLPPAALALHPDAVQLLERLFPRRDFLIAPWDWF